MLTLVVKVDPPLPALDSSSVSLLYFVSGYRDAATRDALRRSPIGHAIHDLDRQTVTSSAALGLAPT